MHVDVSNWLKYCKPINFLIYDSTNIDYDDDDDDDDDDDKNNKSEIVAAQDQAI